MASAARLYPLAFPEIPMVTCLLVVAGLVVAVLLVMRPDLLLVRGLGLELVAQRGLGAAPAAAEVPVGAADLGVCQVERVVVAGELAGRGCDVPRTEEAPVASSRPSLRGRRAGGAAPRPAPSTPPRRVSPRSGATGKGGKGRRS